jgi:hypothetical protein
MIWRVDEVEPSRALGLAQANIGRHKAPFAFSNDETVRFWSTIAVDHEPGNIRPEKGCVEFCRQMPRDWQRARIPGDVCLQRVVGKPE